MSRLVVVQSLLTVENYVVEGALGMPHDSAEEVVTAVGSSCDVFQVVDQSGAVLPIRQGPSVAMALRSARFRWFSALDLQRAHVRLCVVSRDRDGGVLTDGDEPPSVVSAPQVTWPALLPGRSGIAVCIEVFLIHAGQCDVPSDKPDVFDVVSHRSVGKRARQNLGGERPDGFSADQSHSSRAHPHCVVVEQSDERIDIFGALGAFEIRDSR